MTQKRASPETVDRSSDQSSDRSVDPLPRERRRQSRYPVRLDLPMAVGSDLVVLPHLEEVFLARGPAVLSQLVRVVGGLMVASKIAEMAPKTLLEWVQWSPGRVFGTRLSSASHRSIWIGYPPPFPALDRVVEHHCGKSFLEMYSERYGSLAESLEQLRSVRRFGLDDLYLSDLGPDERPRDIPASTFSRMARSLHYPSQWRRLDRLAVADGHMGWVEAVLGCDPLRLRSPAPIQALVVLSSRMATNAGLTGKPSVTLARRSGDG